MTMLEQIIQGRPGEAEVRAAYRRSLADRPAPAAEQGCRPSGGAAARAGRFQRMTDSGFAVYIMPEGF